MANQIQELADQNRIKHVATVETIVGFLKDIMVTVPVVSYQKKSHLIENKNLVHVTSYSLNKKLLNNFNMRQSQRYETGTI